METQTTKKISGHTMHVLNWFFPHGDLIIVENEPRFIPIVTIASAPKSLPITLAIATNESPLYEDIQAAYHLEIKAQMGKDKTRENLIMIYRQ